jgi:hypothetical protein
VERGKGKKKHFEEAQEVMQPPFVELINGCEKFEVKSEFRHTDAFS